MLRASWRRWAWEYGLTIFTLFGSAGLLAVLMKDPGAYWLWMIWVALPLAFVMNVVTKPTHVLVAPVSTVVLVAAQFAILTALDVLPTTEGSYRFFFTVTFTGVFPLSFFSALGRGFRGWASEKLATSRDSPDEVVDDVALEGKTDEETRGAVPSCESQDPRRPSRSGLESASVTLAVINASLLALSFCAFFGVLSELDPQPGDYSNGRTLAFAILAGYVVLGVIPTAVGMALGIVAQRRDRQDAKRSSTGTLMNAVVLGLWHPWLCFALFTVSIATSEALL